MGRVCRLLGRLLPRLVCRWTQGARGDRVAAGHTMNPDIEAELEMLQSVFCLPGEFDLRLKGDAAVVFSICHRKNELQHDLILTFQMDRHYPKTLPLISIQCAALTHRQSEMLKSDMKKELDVVKGQPVVMHIMSWLQENISNLALPVANQSTVCTEESNPANEALDTLLLHINHMRAKRQYVKIITSWCRELDLVGRLLLQGKWIFLILQGIERNVKAYLIRHKSQNVDVDSSGRSCKERMLMVLSESALPKIFPDFRVQEFHSPTELESFFTKYNISDLYRKHVQVIVKR